MLKLTVIASLAASLLGAPLADDPPPVPFPDRVVVDVVTLNGSGCPAGTAAVAISPDNSDFEVTYSAYMAMVGIGATQTDFRKNCQLSLVIHVPQGWTYAVTELDHRGFASLAAGATATVRVNTYFQGQTPTAFRTRNFVGPFIDDWAFDDSPDPASLVYLPCGVLRNFNINTELRVGAGTSDTRHTSSAITMDESHHFRLTYRACATA